mmetsp:Transcript_21266/g.30096  ORF Transcript_21266/g.30096 Transcript_21266/m.30096 type:complete len:202 (+) Transcript_21266:228-833(+)
MKANAVGTIPSPFTSAPSRPRSGKYDDAATSCSISEVKIFPSRLLDPTQVTSMPRSIRLWDVQASVCSTSLRRPRVWSTRAPSGERWGVPRVTSERHCFCAKRYTPVEEPLNPPRNARATQPPIECPIIAISTSGPSAAKMSANPFSMASKYQASVECTGSLASRNAFVGRLRATLIHSVRGRGATRQVPISTSESLDSSR